ncbi:MAG: hypothetical protein WC384_10905 [Prolixibacteraceae bacterium]|jgi:hypothetical protein
MHFESLTPRVPKNYLLLIAALVWTFAGILLLFRGYFYMIGFPHLIIFKIASCILGGLLFFRLMFTRISKKHVLRIKNMSLEFPCMFSFFNLKSYLMMFFMISTGITLRKTGIVSPEYLSFIYVTMGVPLLLSSVRFYHTFFNS